MCFYKYLIAKKDDKKTLLPWKNIQPCGIPVHHIHTKHRKETGQHHNRGSCDQEITWPNNKDSAHKPCSSCHQPVFRHSNN